jgi:phosphotriesterase-related protein
MTTVNSIKGPIDTAQLGPTLMHEHVFIISSVEVQHNYPETWEEETRVSDAIDRLNQLKQRGVDTVVDLTVLGLGRYIPRVQRIAAQTDLNIIVATGLYAYNDLPMYFKFRGPGTMQGGRELMTEMFIRDIEDGISSTGARAGMLKCVTDENGVTPGVDRALRAVAQAHRHTGVPISTHTDAHRRVGLDQQRVFREEGVDLSRVVIGHSGDSEDLAYLEELVGNGSFIGMDRFGLDTPPFLSFEGRVNTVVEMCRRGHSDQMVLSHDTTCFTDCFDVASVPNWHYNHISDMVLPALLERGVSQEEIDQMLVINPRKIFETQGAY